MELRAYQEEAIRRALRQPRLGLFLEMGMGKTIIALETLWRAALAGERVKALVVAPKRVAEQSWPAEVRSFASEIPLTLSVIGAGERGGIAGSMARALDGDSDIVAVSRDNAARLWNECARRGEDPFTVLIVDESQGVRNRGTQRWKACRRFAERAGRVLLLTGTPDPHGLEDLWAQIYLLDNGQRLGRSLTEFRTRWFHPGAHSGAVVYQWLPNRGAKEDILNRICDITMSLRRDDFNLGTAGADVIEEVVDLPKEARDIYQDMELAGIASVGGADVTSASAAAAAAKCQQVADGAIYDDDHNVQTIHTAKQEALEGIIRKAVEAKEQVLVLYAFRFEIEAIRAACARVGAPCRAMESPADIDAWNERRAGVMFAHPSSVALGLNLQRGGHIMVWFGLTWDLELWQQANARLDRPGQTERVEIRAIVARNTVDEAILHSLENKRRAQDATMEWLKSLLAVCSERGAIK